MLLSEQDDRPHTIHSTPTLQERRPLKYSGGPPCPSCGLPKNRPRAKLCWHCWKASKQTVVSEDVFYVEGDACRYIPLTKKQTAIVLASRFDELSKWSWHAIKTIYGNFYAARSEIRDGIKVSILMHRQITNFENECTDHRNHQTLDNRDGNLRPCPKRDDMWHRRKSLKRKFSSKYKGVSFSQKRRVWNAFICLEGKSVYLGQYESEIEAAHAYDNAARKHFGEFAVLNFPDELVIPVPFRKNRRHGR